MSVSVQAMTIVELSQWLAAHPTYATLAEAIEAGQLAATGTEGLGGVAVTVAGGAGTATSSSTVTGATIIDFATAQDLLATGTQVSTSGVGAVSGPSGYSLTGLLGVDLGTAVAAISPLLGVALGVNLYRTNPDLWNKIVEVCRPYCHPNSNKVPAWAEWAAGKWTTFINASIYYAISRLFASERIPYINMPSNGYTSDLDCGIDQPIPYGAVAIYTQEYRSAGKTHQKTISLSGLVSARIGGLGFKILVASDTPQEITYGVVMDYNLTDGTTQEDVLTTTVGSNTYTYDGRTVYYVKSTVGTGTVSRYVSVSGNVIEDLDEADPGPTAWTIIYGTPTSDYEYQPGTSEWGGTPPATVPLGKPAVVDPSGGTEDTVKVSFPIEVDPDHDGSNPASPDPEEQPDPTETTDPDSQISPYIMPYPVPWEVPYSEPITDPQPELDPAEPRPPAEEVTDPPRIFDLFPTGVSDWDTNPTTDPPFAQNVGLITVYHPTSAQLYDFERWLWVTYADATIDKIWNNPFDGVITLFELYCTPTDIGNRNIHCGFLDSQINSAVISRYTEINCGTLGIPEYYGNYFDYSPYSKAHIYLPFIGIQELNVDDIVGHAVNVTYRIDEYNGSCIAMITVAKSTTVNGVQQSYRNTMYQFSGNCSVELPLSGGTQASIRSGMMMASAYQHAANVSSTASLVGGLASALASLGMGNIGGAIGSAINGIGQAAATQAYGQATALSNMLSGKSTVQKSGSFGSSQGAMGIKKPFITITRPKQIQVQNYNELYGYPAHKAVTIGTCEGFIRCREVNVVSPTANDEEKALIEQYLKTGVYIS